MLGGRIEEIYLAQSGRQFPRRCCGGGWLLVLVVAALVAFGGSPGCGSKSSSTTNQYGDTANVEVVQVDNVTLTITDPGRGEEVPASELFPLKVGASWGAWRIDGTVERDGSLYYRAVCTGYSCNLTGAVVPVRYLAYSQKGLVLAGLSEFGWLEKPIVLLPAIVRNQMKWTTANLPRSGKPETIALALRVGATQLTAMGEREIWLLAIDRAPGSENPDPLETSLFYTSYARGVGPSFQQLLTGVDGPEIERPRATTTIDLPSKGMPLALSGFEATNKPLSISLMQLEGADPVLMVRANLPCEAGSPQRPRCERVACYGVSSTALSELPVSTETPQIGRLLLTTDGSLCPIGSIVTTSAGYLPAYSMPLSEGTYWYPATPVLGEGTIYGLLGDDKDVPYIWSAATDNLHLNGWEKTVEVRGGAMARLGRYTNSGVSMIRGLASGLPRDALLHTWLSDGKIFEMRVTPEGQSRLELVDWLAGLYTSQRTPEGVRFVRATIDGELLSVRGTESGLVHERLAQIADIPDGELLVAGFRYLDPTSQAAKLLLVTQALDRDDERPPALTAYLVDAPQPETIAAPKLAKILAVPSGYDLKVCWGEDRGAPETSGWTLAGKPPLAVLPTSDNRCVLLVRDPNTIDSDQDPFTDHTVWGAEGPIPGIGVVRVANAATSFSLTLSNTVANDELVAALKDGSFVTESLLLDNLGLTTGGHGIGIRATDSGIYFDAGGLGIWHLDNSSPQSLELVGGTQRVIESPKLPEWGDYPRWNVRGQSLKGGLLLMVEVFGSASARFFYRVDGEGVFNPLPDPPDKVEWRIELKDGTLCGADPDLYDQVFHCRTPSGELKQVTAGLTRNSTAFWYVLRDGSAVVFGSYDAGVWRFDPAQMSVAPLSDKELDYRSLRYGYDATLTATVSDPQTGQTLMLVEPTGLQPLPELPDRVKGLKVSRFVRGRDVDLVYFKDHRGFLRLPRTTTP